MRIDEVTVEFDKAEYEAMKQLENKDLSVDELSKLADSSHAPLEADSVRAVQRPVVR